MTFAPVVLSSFSPPAAFLSSTSDSTLSRAGVAAAASEDAGVDSAAFAKRAASEAAGEPFSVLSVLATAGASGLEEGAGEETAAPCFTSTLGWQQ